MRSKKLFGIINTINIALWFIIISNLTLSYYNVTLAGYHFQATSSYENDFDYFLVPGICTLIFVSFFFTCLRLNKLYGSTSLLSDRARLIGPLVSIFSSILTLLFIWVSIGKIRNSFKYELINYGRPFIISITFFSFTITSIYLNVAYWFIRKKIKSQFSNEITQIGN